MNNIEPQDVFLLENNRHAQMYRPISNPYIIRMEQSQEEKLKRLRLKRTMMILFSFILILNTALASNEILILQQLISGGKVTAVDFAETFDMTLTDKLLYVDLKINGSSSSYRFIFDTYAVNLIRQNLIDCLNLEVTELTGFLAQQLGTSLIAPTMVKFDTIQLGNLSFQDHGGFAIKEDQNHDIMTYLEDGILGANLMKNAIWQINFRDSIIKVSDKISQFDFIEGAILLPFKPHSLQKSPDIQVVVNEEDTLDLQFDTGSNKGLKFITDKMASYKVQGRCAKLTSIPSLTMDAESTELTESYVINLDSVKIGSKIFKDLPVEIFESTDESLIGKGQLGNAFMRHFIVTIDWFSNMIYLYPRTENPLEKQKKSFGLTIGYRDGAVQIISLYEGSQAEEMELRIGDRVLSIDGKDMTNLSEEEIRLYRQGFQNFTDEKNETILISVENNGTTRDIKLESYYLFHDLEIKLTKGTSR
jgi:hypothetical protein